MTTAVLGWLIVGFIIFLFIREFFMWYWKVNRVVSSLENMEETLEDIKENLELALSHKKHHEEKST